MNDFLAHAELAEALEKMQLAVSASDLHGSLVGYLCGGGRAAPGHLLDVLELESDDAHARDRAHAMLERLQKECLAQLEDDGLGFNPLLPSDRVPLDERAEALVEWCRGFLGGFGLAGVDAHKQLSADGTEVLRDFASIAASQLDVDDGDEDERALMEVLEFVRVGAMLLFAEIANAGRPASKTVH